MVQAAKPFTFRKTIKQREATKLLTGPAAHTLLFGGSRSGKTFIIVRQIIARAILEDKSRHCILRKHFTDVNKAIICDTFPKVMELCFPGLPYHLNKALFFVEFPNGSEIWFGGLDNGDKILGNEYSTMYFNEVSELTYDQLETAYSRNAQKCKNIRNRFYYDENPVGKAHWSYKLFVLGINPVDNTPIRRPENYVSMRLNPVDNADNLSSTYIDDLQSLSAKKRARFFEGEWYDDNENALWKREKMINPYRVQSNRVPAIERLVIGVDPAVTNNATSDLTGIVVCGNAMNHTTGNYEYYVFDDCSMKGSPNEWAQKISDLYVDYSADRVIVEVNNGGDLVESLLRRLDSTISVESVRATRGKIIRAEPIASLYERGLVHHVGEFPLLEDEMCNFTGGEQEKSPDRMDALVWGLTALSAKRVDRIGSLEMALSY
jgi:phage terminase large subunit-like protein